MAMGYFRFRKKFRKIKLNPDLRLGQLICDLMPVGMDLYALVDSVLIQILLTEKEKLK